MDSITQPVLAPERLAFGSAAQPKRKGFNTNKTIGSGTSFNGNTVTNYLVCGVGLDFQRVVISNNYHVPGAAYDAQSCSGCTQGTRIQVLRDIDAWIKDPDGPKLFWLRGMAGTGKTAIAWTVCSRADKDDDVVLGGSYFCSHDDEFQPQRDVSRIVPTLAQHLALQADSFSAALAGILADDPFIVDGHVHAQVEQLLHAPLNALKGSAIPLLFVIDALDRCSKESDRAIIEMVGAISQIDSEIPVRLLITSRPDSPLYEAITATTDCIQHCDLQSLDEQQITADIHLYVADTLLRTIKLRAEFTDSEIAVIAQVSECQFDVAAIAVRYALGAGMDGIAARIHSLLNACRRWQKFGRMSSSEFMSAFVGSPSPTEKDSDSPARIWLRAKVSNKARARQPNVVRPD